LTLRGRRGTVGLGHSELVAISGKWKWEILWCCLSSDDSHKNNPSPKP
jgi:hypothetical protein